MNAWLPEFGSCICTWQEFARKEQRDYAASQAAKRPDYLTHKVGIIETTKRNKRADVGHWLAVYTKENLK